MKALRLAALLALGFCGAADAQGAKAVRITADEGTSMSVAVSPDGKSLAMDLQGSIWVLPASGGEAHRVTDLFNDARQPVWAADGKSIVFFAYRDGGYHLWSVSPDGTGQRQITRGMFDEREPAVSHDGSRIAFSSDRGNPLGSDYNIFVLDLRSGETRQLTHDPAEDSMPSWSADDRQVIFASTREDGHGVWAVDAAGGPEQRVAQSSARVIAAARAPSEEIVAQAIDGASPISGPHGWLEVAGKSITGNEMVFPFRPSSCPMAPSITSPTARLNDAA